MCIARTARRRRKQHRQGFNHIHAAKRPHYSKSSSGIVKKFAKAK